MTPQGEKWIPHSAEEFEVCTEDVSTFVAAAIASGIKRYTVVPPVKNITVGVKETFDEYWANASCTRYGYKGYRTKGVECRTWLT